MKSNKRNIKEEKRFTTFLNVKTEFSDDVEKLFESIYNTCKKIKEKSNEHIK